MAPALVCGVSEAAQPPSLLPLLAGSSTAVQTSVWSWVKDVITSPANFLIHWPQSPGAPPKEHLLSEGRPKQQVGKEEVTKLLTSPSAD